MKGCVELRTNGFPRAKEEKWQEFYEVCIVDREGRTIQTTIYAGTHMCNYWPMTEVQMAEREARYAAKGLAKNLGLELVDLTGK
jgi:hypothetical protein